ncbi:MAG: tRNA (adenosine(37)-N6)-dimethylallyltransferase MiaA [Pseudomonadota bacterium]
MKEGGRRQRRFVLIAGPTASGKSALALDVAECAMARGRPAVIVNADSMQVYRELRVITARPELAQEVRVHHELFGYVSVADVYSTGAWLRAVRQCLDRIDDRALIVFVGGTGLYFKALTEGFAEIPDVPTEVRARVRDELARDGKEALFSRLRAVDPEGANALDEGDPQRILRALEVYEATGRPLGTWKKEGQTEALLEEFRCRKLVLLPDRSDLYSRINKRFQQMVDQGALDEVRALIALELPLDRPAMKAIGVPQLAAYLRGETDLQGAIESASQDSRRYAKRQMTWLRNQMGDDWQRLSAREEADLSTLAGE